jgi:FkbM family methyltransferase
LEVFSTQFAVDMPIIFCRKITRRTPFEAEKVPWIARIYSDPFNRWNSLGRQALFGAPNFLMFFLFQKFWPFKTIGKFTYKINGRKIYMLFNVRNTQFHALYFNKFSRGYEPQTSALLETLLPDDGIFYDIGSNWGWFTLFLASKPGFRGSIHAFEPFVPSYSDLCSLVEQAGLGECVHTHHLALSERTGLTSMRLPDKFQSGQAVMEENPNHNAIPTASLDSLNLPPPNLIKADVEGAEIKVFQGGSRLLAEHKPMLVFENSRHMNHPWNTLEPFVLLRNMGYNFFQVGWLREIAQNSFLIGDDNDFAPQEEETLALAPFDWRERLLRYDGLNVLACHNDKISELKSLFVERLLEK